MHFRLHKSVSVCALPVADSSVAAHLFFIFYYILLFIYYYLLYNKVYIGFLKLPSFRVNILSAVVTDMIIQQT